MKKLTEKAVKAAASYNAFLMKEKREERRHYFDIQTGVGVSYVGVSHIYGCGSNMWVCLKYVGVYKRY